MNQTTGGTIRLGAQCHRQCSKLESVPKRTNKLCVLAFSLDLLIMRKYRVKQPHKFIEKITVILQIFVVCSRIRPQIVI